MLDVADDAVVGDLEDGSVGVAVNGDDELAFVHSGEMLDGAGDADGKVELGLDGFAGLAYLFGIGTPACVDQGAGGADCGAELVGEGFEKGGEGFGGAHAAASGDDDVGFGEGDAAGLLRGATGDLEAGGGEVEIDVELLGRAGEWGGGGKGSGLDGDDDEWGCGFDRFSDAGEEGVVLGLEGVSGGGERGDVFEEGGVEADGDAGAVLATAAGGGDEDGVGFALGGDLGDGGGPEVGVVVS